MATKKGWEGWLRANIEEFGRERFLDSLLKSLRADPRNSQVSAPGSENKDYFMDGASIVCAKSVEALPGDVILDACAAPGGKSLVMANVLSSSCSSVLVSNELSSERRKRLRTTLSSQNLNFKFFITGEDVSGTVMEIARKSPYDKILVDAPCSSDRHLLQNNLIDSWSLKGVKSQAERQLKILNSLAPLVKVGGRLVYSTCALNSLENDKVIESFLKKSRNFQVNKNSILSTVLQEIPQSEITGIGGVLILPDKTGFGPLYICHLVRCS